MKKTKMLKKNYEFKHILNKGTYFSGKNIAIFFKKNNKNMNFLGIAISSKIGKAVKRNYIKRLIREVYKNVEEELKIGYSIIFLWKKNSDIQQACYENVKKDIIKIFKNAEIFLEE